jgi:TPR repeat protein
MLASQGAEPEFLRVCPFFCPRVWARLRGQINLGIAYANGDGVAQSDSDAVRWLSAAKAAGLVAEAQQVKKKGCAHVLLVRPREAVGV